MEAYTDQENLSGMPCELQWHEEREADFQKWKEEYIDTIADTYDEQAEYAEYIMKNCHGDRLICNDDTLIEAMESGYLWDDFLSKRYEDSLK